MKYLLIGIVIFTVSIVSIGILGAANEKGVRPESGDMSDVAASHEPGRVYPIAAGVWYPTDGPIPEKPMRYYRVRCWPGCHTGSSLGMYPDDKLHDMPIHYTSTIDKHPKIEKEK
ncbi:MAG: hypothetical protein GY859_33685 [Desulfobacterales bacterium]|nr:hypothetical protein [Desulfobacterales bacterium]